MILFHVIFALTSIVFTTFAYIKPSKNKLRVSYVLAALTLSTGTYLIVTSPAHLVQSCIMGISYFGAVTTALIFARRKLAHELSLV